MHPAVGYSLIASTVAYASLVSTQDYPRWFAAVLRLRTLQPMVCTCTKHKIADTTTQPAVARPPGSAFKFKHEF
jgi:hypothetical protein